MTSIVRSVLEQQHAWAHAMGIPLDDAGYTLHLNDNLFVPLSPDSLAEFVAGDGAELGAEGRRGKMQSLRSSSALACNFFEYWRSRDAAPLASALGIDAEITGIRYEAKCPTGLLGNAPNLDVVLSLSDGSVIAIESKFLEPYGGRHAVGFKPAYFSAGEVWGGRGLGACQRLAEAIQEGEVSYRWLHAEQLLKHVLGLARGEREWSLWYAWFRPEGREGDEHAAEVRDFEARVRSDGLGFRAVTYQELLGGLRTACGEEHSAYVRWLGERYGGGAADL